MPLAFPVTPTFQPFWLSCVAADGEHARRRRPTQARRDALGLEPAREPVVEMLLALEIRAVRPPVACLHSCHVVQNDSSRMRRMSLELIDSWVEEGDVRGVSAVVVDASGVREARTAGDARPDSLFALASLTKPLVAAAVLVAAEEGALDLDDPVASHVPES